MILATGYRVDVRRYPFLGREPPSLAAHRRRLPGPGPRAGEQPPGFALHRRSGRLELWSDHALRVRQLVRGAGAERALDRRAPRRRGEPSRRRRRARSSSAATIRAWPSPAASGGAGSPCSCSTTSARSRPRSRYVQRVDAGGVAARRQNDSRGAARGGAPVIALAGWLIYPTRDETCGGDRPPPRSRSPSAIAWPRPVWDVIRCGVGQAARPTPRRPSSAIASAAVMVAGFDVRPGTRRRAAALRRQAGDQGALLLRHAASRRGAPMTHAELDAPGARAAGALVGVSEVVVQELIPGGGEAQVAYCAWFKDGEARAAMTAQRLRQHPMEFGRATTYARTITDPGVAEPSQRLLPRDRLLRAGRARVQIRCTRRRSSSCSTSTPVLGAITGWPNARGSISRSTSTPTSSGYRRLTPGAATQTSIGSAWPPTCPRGMAAVVAGRHRPASLSALAARRRRRGGVQPR